MGILQKLQFWKKRNNNRRTFSKNRNNNTRTQVDACVFSEDPQTCDAATVTMDPTVMCNAYTQTETRMDGAGSGSAAKEEYEREHDMKNHDEQETTRRLEDKNEKLSALVEQYYNLAILNHEVEQTLREEIS